MKKRILFAMIGILGIISSLIILSGKKENLAIKKVTTQEAINFLSLKKNSESIPVTNEIHKTFQKNKIDEGDFIQSDEKNLYIVDYHKLYIIEMDTLNLISEISFQDFMPTEVLLTSTQIVLLGIKEIELEVDIQIGRTFPYSISECCIYILNKETYSIERYLSFDSSYYVTSALYQNALYFVLSCNNIFNPETKKFIYPAYFDSYYQQQKLSEKELYLAEDGNHVYAIRLIGKLELNATNPLTLRGFLGVEGLTSIMEDYILFATSLVQNEEMIAIHALSLNDLSYKGTIQLKGYLMNQHSLNVYDHYLRVATSYYKNNGQINVLYNISLFDFKVKSKKEIAPLENIYAIRFEKNLCYLATYLYIDPLFIFDFSDPAEIKMVKEKKVDFVCSYIQTNEDTIMALGQRLNESMMSEGMNFVLMDKNTLSILDIYEIQEKYIGSELFYNDKALSKQKDKLIFPTNSEEGQKIQVFEVNKSIKHMASISCQEEYILRTMIYKEQIICIGSLFINSYHLNDYSLLKSFQYKKNMHS